MKYKKLSILILSSILLCSCVNTNTFTNTSISNNISSEIASNHSEEKIESTTNTTESTTEMTTSEESVTTTTIHETVHYLKQIKLVDGVLPDGEYMISIKQLDEDDMGADFSVRGLWNISEDEYNALEIGDIVFLEDTAYTYREHILCRDVEWGEELIEIEPGYLMDGYEPWVYLTYVISNDYHMFLDTNYIIYGDGITYNSLEDFWKDTLDNYNFCKMKGYEVSENVYTCVALATIKDNKVCSMWINPEEHELWMIPELHEQKYGSLKNREGSILSYSSDIEYNDYEIKMLSNEGLRYAINEIWARHGYIFRNQEILEYYRQFEWYVESVPADEWDKNGQNYYLNTIEQANMKKLTKERDNRS